MSVKIYVITGDHTKPDPEKHTGQYLEEDFIVHNAMVKAFRSYPHLNVEVINNHTGLLEKLKTNPPDLIVNFCDTGFYNNIALELHLPAYFELLNIPYTGATASAIAMVYDKAVVRLLAQSLNIPVPREIFLRAQDVFDASQMQFPALIKPNCADGSLGITKDAVVKNAEQANNYIDWLHKALPGRDILIQEYLSGDEYGVGLIGNVKTGLEALPILEVDYSKLPTELNPILSYESKAVPDSPYWTSIQFKPAQLSKQEEQTLIQQSRRLFERLKLRDYGRFDFRRGSDGIIKLMESNPNPAWGNDGKLAFMASFGGISYEAMLFKILQTACLRYGLVC